MALEAPLRSSTGSVMSAFSPHTEMSISSPESPAVHSQFVSLTSASSDSHSLRPNSAMRAHSAPFHLLSPGSDIVGPSPVTSNGTEVTEIEDEPAEDTIAPSRLSAAPPHQQLTLLRTNISDQDRKALSEEAVSVIHAPENFGEWTSTEPKPEEMTEGSTTSEVEPPDTLPSEGASLAKISATPPPIATNVQPVGFSLEGATPQAQNLQEVINTGSRIRSSSVSSLELIPENSEAELNAESAFEDEEFATPNTTVDHSEVVALRTALEECWTLCNTLANLSSHHRERVFNNSGTPDAHEKAWKSCWKLCQRLYNSRDDTIESFNVRTNLDLCRDFCQALFDVRQRKEEIADSVLRVSFELNNHLYSAQDNRNLPEAFRERTLDFYITLCHRLMKQRSELAVETDSLLRACWSLAEMLFSLRQNRRDGKPVDEELLGSAVQACWELCDIFRDGWTQIRPDRGTPRPSQVNFPAQSSSTDARSGAGSRASIHSKRESLKGVPEDRGTRKHPPPPVPETPVTEFEDTPISPESRSPQLQNIMVLGTGSETNRSTGVGSGPGRWSSSASNLSGYSQGSQKTSSTATTATSAEDTNVTRVKVLILKAAMNIGFSRDAAAAADAGHGGGASSLQTFVKSLPTGSFGSLPAHATLLQNYKNLVLADPAFRSAPLLPVRGRRVNSAEMAKSVGWMMLRSPQYGFLRDLYKLVFGFLPEDVESRKNVSIAV